MLLGGSPADRTASFQLGKDCVTKYSEIPASETNSERVGARPSPLAMALMESKICCLADIGSLLWSAAAWRRFSFRSRGDDRSLASVQESHRVRLDSTLKN